ncbi:MAG: amino acid permease [Mesorhizobium sp.]|nr:amino acid permease [Mesorhizobium sp. M4B.F.Ca.ET.058.02.1.1]RWC47570.1 MAG: amino acid permease [Mesorhizobium sp.]RWD08048.1 MAG: amino acid permease [Mesorhizobium sp.]RWD18338.1 MAG: amino acid permease [Mesorhizobium sp.]RWD58020.1 MAG: amino acid permease [Mesorhizobium sp.]
MIGRLSIDREGILDRVSSDASRLQELGYRQQLRRGLGVFSTFSIGVATVAPVVGLYAIFGLGMNLSGPVWVWLLVLSLVGQVLVAVVYAELASEFPIAGGPYQWVRRLIGPDAGIFTGLIYLVAVSAALATVAFLAAPWFAQLLGLQPSPGGHMLLSFCVLLASLLVNAGGVQVVRVAVNFGIAAEIIASMLIGSMLLVFFRTHDVTVLFSSMGAPTSLGAALATLAVCGWAFVGFDASASVAEETTGAGANVPRAILAATAVVGIAVVLVAVAVILATGDLQAVISGSEMDPVTATVVASLGGWSRMPFLAVVAITFFACCISMQAYLGRVIFSLARDGVLPFSRKLASVSEGRKVPLVAMTTMTLIASACLLLGFNEGAVGTMISFGTAGLYITFLLVVAAALYARVSGKWRPDGSLRLGALGTPVNVAALVWLVFETINIAWPRVELAPPNAPVWQVWAAIWVFAVVAALAVIYIGAWRRKNLAAE